MFSPPLIPEGFKGEQWAMRTFFWLEKTKLAMCRHCMIICTIAATWQQVLNLAMKRFPELPVCIMTWGN